MTNTLNNICIFTDGSTLNNNTKSTRYGGYGVFFSDNDERNISASINKKCLLN